MTRPAPYTTADLFMEVELLRAALDYCRRIGTPFDTESVRPLLRESAVRGAYRILDHGDLQRQIDDIFTDRETEPS